MHGESLTRVVQALAETFRRFCRDIEKLARCDEDPEPIDLSGWFSRARRRLAEAEAHIPGEHLQRLGLRERP
jgi:hypothetical protein